MKPKILLPTVYSKIKSNDIIIKIIIHVENTNFFNLLLEFSKKILRDNTNKINLKKPNTLDKLFSKFVLKNKLIKKLDHNKISKIKNLSLKILRYFFLRQKIMNIKDTNIVFKFINKLPNKKLSGYSAIIKARKINKLSSLYLIFNFCNIMFD